jgi:hypothetical protein
MDSMRCGSSGLHAELSYVVLLPDEAVLLPDEALGPRHACLPSLIVSIRFPRKLLWMELCLELISSYCIVGFEVYVNSLVEMC